MKLVSNGDEWSVVFGEDLLSEPSHQHAINPFSYDVWYLITTRTGAVINHHF